MYAYWNRVSPAEARAITGVLSRQMHTRIAPGDGWKYNFSDKTVYYREEDLSRLTETDVVANILHEVGHAKYSDAPADLDYSGVQSNHKKQYKELVNIVEDFRIEDLVRDEYPHAREYLPDYSFKTRFILETTARQMGASEIPMLLKYFICLYSRIAGDYLEQSIPISAAERKTLRDLVDQTIDYAIDARYTENTHALNDILRLKIYPIIKHLFIHDAEDDADKMVGVMVRVAGHGSGDAEHENTDLFQDPSGKVRSALPETARVLKRLLSSRSFDKYAGKHRSGKLNQRRLYKFGAGDYRLFQKRQAAEIKKDAVALLVDVSGSMRFSRTIQPATDAAMLFAQALEKIGVDYILATFNDDYKVHKSLGQAGVGRRVGIFKDIHDRSLDSGSGSNNDGYAVMETANRLLAAENKKVLFVISDGEPAPSSNYVQYNLFREIEVAEKRGVSVVGFGVGDGTLSVTRYYDNHVVVKDISQLASIMGKTLAKSLGRK